jgi:Gram-negative porin
MRSIRLLMSAGAMLSLAAGSAYAGRIMGMQGNPQTPTDTGLVTGLSGFQEMGSPYQGGEGLETETAAPFSVPAPGTINMRINSFVNEFPMITWFSGQNGNGTPASNAGNKMQGFGIYGWIRIDLGIDGQTKNGIKYGAFTEIRENNTTAITGGTTSATSGFAQSASGDSSDNTLYVRHANVYLGTDQVGFLRIGTGIAAQTLFETGLTDDFDIGGWDSFNSTNIPSNMVPVWPWADDGQQYMAAAITYVTPVISGFDGGISFIPNNSTPFDGSGCSEPYGGVGCVTQSSSQLPGDYENRYRNEVSLALRYRNVFGPIGFDMSGIWSISGRVNNAETPQQYKGLNIGDVGAEFTINHAWNISGNVMWGNFNGAWALQPEGGTSATAWVVGTRYTIMQAPLTLGAYYFNYNYNGLATPRPVGVGQRNSRGLDVGAVYGLGPGVVLIAEYAWGQNSQNGFDFLTNENGPNSNKVWAQVLTAGMSVRF